MACVCAAASATEVFVVYGWTSEPSPAARADVSPSAVSCLIFHVLGRKWGQQTAPGSGQQGVSTNDDLDLAVWFVCFDEPTVIVEKGLASSRNMLSGEQGLGLLAQPGCGCLPGPTEPRVVGAQMQPLRGSSPFPAQMGMNSPAAIPHRG